MRAYDEYSQAIFRYIFLKISDRERALDLSQETFTRAWESIIQGTHVINMKAFLYRIARNIVIDEYRKKKSESLDALFEEGYDFRDTKAPEVIDQIDGGILLKQLEGLEEKYRDVLMMRYVEDLSIKEIARITGEAENTVSVRIHRAIAKARTLFNQPE